MDKCPPDHPFVSSDLPRLELTHGELTRMVVAGAVRRVFYGGYLPTCLEDSIETRAALVARLLPAHHVVTGRTAAWLWGEDTYTWSESDTIPALDVCALRGHEPTQRHGIDGHTRDLSARDITVVADVRVTTPLRTAMDLGCTLKAREALAVLDAFARDHGVSVADLRSELPRFRRRRGVRQLRALVPLVDPRAESPRESWVRYEIHAAGLPAAEPQYWILINGVRTFRLDLAYVRRRVAVEYDGFDAHERTQEQRDHDNARREWLRKNGWTVIVVRRGDFTGRALERWLRELRDALTPSYSPVRKLERGRVRG